VEEPVKIPAAGGDMPQRIRKPEKTNGRIEFRVSQDRLLETSVRETKTIIRIALTVFGIKEGAFVLNTDTLNMLYEQLDTATAFLAKFVWRDGGYLPPEEALPLCEELSLAQIFDGLIGIVNKMQDVAVPNVSSGTSDLP
jgi:hypothetical protein